MASLKYLVHLDLLQNELQNVRLQQLSSAPTSPSPVTGQMYYNTGDNKAYVYNGSDWVDVMQQTSTYTLPEATATVRGGIELASNTDNPVVPNAVSSTAGRTYGLQLTSGGQGVINVPWVNTTYSVGDGGLTTNDFTNADHSKLNAIEPTADVTDATNVEAAGALMDSEVTNLAQVKAFDSSDYATDTQGDLADTAHGWGNHASAGYSTATGVENSADVTDAQNVRAALNSAMGSNTLTIGDGSTVTTFPGSIVVTGDTTYHNETIQIVENNTISFEGATADAHEVHLTSADATADRTITLPDATGTVALTSNITGTNSGTNTGDETKSSIEGLAIQTVGAVTSGSWTATDVAVSHGGTGASTAADARTNLGLTYASDAEALAGSLDNVVVTPGNLAARSYRETIGDASNTSFTVNHALGTKDVMVQLYDGSSGATVVAQVVRDDANNITVSFNTAPTDDDVIVLVNKID